jgi:hypothetical protein
MIPARVAVLHSVPNKDGIGRPRGLQPSQEVSTLVLETSDVKQRQISIA